jgi:type I restriction enzyme S subunit
LIQTEFSDDFGDGSMMKEKWQAVHLGQYFKLKHGWAFKGKFFAKEGKYILLTPGNFNPDGGIKLKGDKEKYYIGDFPAEFLLKSDDLLVVMTDLTQDAPILGSPAFITENDKFLHNQRLGKVVDLDDTQINRAFLYYLFNSSIVRNQIKATANGTTVKHTSPGRIYNVEVNLPSLPTQQKIAAVLSPYDQLIANNTRRIQILEEMAQIIYRQWFVEFQFPGHEQVPMVESELGMIPKGWEIGKLGDIVDNIRKTEKPGKHLEPLPYVPIDCIPRRSIALMQHKPSREAKSSLIAFKRNDILFGAMRAYFHKVTFAPFDGITRQTCFVLRSKNPNNYPFDLFTIFQDSTVKYASNYSTGSTIPYATWDGALAVMPIVNPPDSLIQKFSDIVTPMLDSMRMMAMKNTNLRKTRDLLLPKLISGELDVSTLDIAINRENSDSAA